MHESDIDAVDSEPLKTIFDRTPHPGCGIIENDVVWSRGERKVVFTFRRFRRLKQFAHFCGNNVLGSLLVVQKTAISAFRRTESVPGRHVKVTDAGVPSCLDRRVSILVGYIFEFVAERNPSHAECERRAIM